MILLLGDFPSWLPIFTLIGGVTTAIIAGLVTSAVAGSLAAGIRSAVEGNWPWEDPEAFFLDQLKGQVGGVGSVISAARGEPSLMEQLKTASSSRAEGSGGVLQGATGQGPLQAENAALAAGGARAPGFQLGMPQPDPAGGGGAARYDTGEQSSAPSRGDILKGAAKDVGIGLGTTVASFALPYVGQALGGLGQVAGATGTAVKAVAPTVTEAVPAVAGVAAKSAPSFATTAMNAVRAVPNFLGDTATGILQQSLLGAGKGALSATLQGQDPGRAAAMGGAGGLVGGIAGYGAQQLQPAPVPTLAPNPFPMPEIGAPEYVGAMAPGAPTLTSSLTSSLAPKLGSAVGSGLVGHLMQPPLPPQPGAPVYSSRPSYYDVYDIGGPQATYGGRRPYWG